jgi:hypothetical protein
MMSEDHEHENETEAVVTEYTTYIDGRDLSVSSRAEARQKLEEDMQRFLTQGGTINRIDPNVRTDPPRRPENSYGTRPI